MAAIIFFARLGNFSLFNPDEGLYAEPAREMLETGQYITTTLNYVVRFTKPPLVIWAMAAAYKMFGINEFAARIFCAISGFILTIVTYLFANKYLGSRVAIFAACILLTSPLFVGVGRMAITDMPLSLFMAGSLFSFFHAWKQKRKLWLYLGYILTAFAVMTKGPVGLLLPIVILTSFLYLCSATKDTIKFFSLPIGALIVALIALPWFVIEITITNGAYFNEFIMRENFARFTSVVDSHKGPWFYHIAVVFGGLFPWSILLPQSIIRVVKNIYSDSDSWQSKIKSVFSLLRSGSIIRVTKNIYSDSDNGKTKIKSIFSLVNWGNSCQNLKGANEVLLFALISAIVIIFFFSLSVSKLLPYTLPAFPALAIIISYQWDIFIQSKQRKSILIYCLTMSLVYLGAACLAPIALKFLRDAPPELIALIFQYACLMTAITLFCTLLATYKHLLLSSAILFSTIVISTAVFLPQFLSVVCQFWEEEIPQYARSISMSKNPLIVYRLRKPGIPFYLGRRVIQSNDKDDLSKTTKTLGSCYLITSRKYLSEAELIGYKVITKKDNFALLGFTQ